MDKQLQTWSIIIFAFNEDNSIGKVIKQSLEALKELNPDHSELIIVNDGSTDKTEEEIRTYLPNDKILVINHPTNQGIGQALLSGYRKARFENICAIPADGQFNTQELLPFSVIPPQTIISFYRTQKIRYTLFRKSLSYFNKFLNRYLLGIKLRDVNWIKIYKKEFFDHISPVLTSSLVESENCAKMLKNKYKVVEVPSTYHPRDGGVSKGASIKIIFLAFIELIKLYFNLKFTNRNKKENDTL